MNAEIQEWPDADTGKVNSYPQGKPNIFRQGQIVYAQEGCASCHTQMIRPTYMGFESWRPDFGKEGTIEEPVRIRETRLGDYDGERFAYLGNQRIGPDLSNVGYRHEESWHHEHLYLPQSKRDFSMMPSFRHLYKKRKIKGRTDFFSFFEYSKSLQYSFHLLTKRVLGAFRFTRHDDAIFSQMIFGHTEHRWYLGRNAKPLERTTTKEHSFCDVALRSPQKNSVEGSV